MQVVQQEPAFKDAMDQRLQLAHLAQRVGGHAVDGAPGHEALAVGGQRAQAGRDAVGDDQQRVVSEQVRDVLLVVLQLVVGGPDVGVLVAGVLELQQHQRQAVDEQKHIGPASALGPLDGELVDGQPVVERRVVEVDELDAVAAGFAVLLELDGHALHQPAVNLSVSRHEAGNVGRQHAAQRVFLGAGRDVRVEPLDGGTQTVREHHLAVAVALGARGLAVRRRDSGTVGGVPSKAGQPLQRGLFEVVF